MILRVESGRARWCSNNISRVLGSGVLRILRVGSDQTRVRTGPAGRTREGFHFLTGRVRSSQVVFKTKSYGPSGQEVCISHWSDSDPRDGCVRSSQVVFQTMSYGSSGQEVCESYGSDRITQGVASGRVRWCSKQYLTGPRVRRFTSRTGRILYHLIPPD